MKELEDLCQRAADFVQGQKKVSVSAIQLHLSVGRAKASSIVSILEENRIIKPISGNQLFYESLVDGLSDYKIVIPPEFTANRTGSNTIHEEEYEGDIDYRLDIFQWTIYRIVLRLLNGCELRKNTILNIVRCSQKTANYILNYLEATNIASRKGNKYKLEVSDIAEFEAIAQLMLRTDTLAFRAALLAASYGELSASLLQKRFHVGYSRASAIIDEFKQRGIIPPEKGTSNLLPVDANMALAYAKETYRSLAK